MEPIRLARMAMACRFELVLHGEDAVWLRAAGEEALAEVARLETQLTIFDPSSEVSRINARAADEPVHVEAGLYRLLKKAQGLHRETDGAFDLTVGPLMKAWGFFRETGHLPDPDVLDEARRCTGMHLVRLDDESRSVRFEHEGVKLDFGAIGKGYAVDEAIRLLREAGVDRAFLHGGTSTMYALGAPVDEDAWKVAIPSPRSGDEPIAVVRLRNGSMSVSAVWGKAFESGGKVFGHVLDPREGRPVEGALLAAVAADSATDSDALSTALLVSGTVPATGEYRSLTVLPIQNKDAFQVVDAGLSATPSALHPKRL